MDHQSQVRVRVYTNIEVRPDPVHGRSPDSSGTVPDTIFEEIKLGSIQISISVGI